MACQGEGRRRVESVWRQPHQNPLEGINLTDYGQALAEVQFVPQFQSTCLSNETSLTNATNTTIVSRLPHPAEDEADEPED